MRKFYLSLSRYVTVLLILVTSVAWSQSKTVNGKVTSADDGSGIPGVNVLKRVPALVPLPMPKEITVLLSEVPQPLSFHLWVMLPRKL